MIASTAVVVALGVGTSVVLTRVSAGSSVAAPQGPAPADTTVVVKANLADQRAISGKLGYGSETTLAGRKQGTITELPNGGAVVECGGTVYKVDAKPVPLFCGSIPLYRPVGPGMDKGPDVKMVEENLKKFGYGSGLGTPDEKFTAATEAAIKKWQKALGLDQNGTINPGDVIITAGPFRISTVTAQLGGQGAGDLLKYTGVNRGVVVQLKSDQRDLAKVGAKVMVVAGGKSVAGTITRIEEAPPDSNPMPGSSSDTKFNVSITVDDPSKITADDGTSVDVSFTASNHENVLAVPVGALVALAEGGYAVELADTHKFVKVELGLFSGGKVEVSGPDVREGMRVVTTS